jgi:hypothetical protein
VPPCSYWNETTPRNRPSGRMSWFRTVELEVRSVNSRSPMMVRLPPARDYIEPHESSRGDRERSSHGSGMELRRGTHSAARQRYRRGQVHTYQAHVLCVNEHHAVRRSCCDAMPGSRRPWPKPNPVTPSSSHAITLDLCQSHVLPAVVTPRSLDLAHLRTALWSHGRGEDRPLRHDG